MTMFAYNKPSQRLHQCEWHHSDVLEINPDDDKIFIRNLYLQHNRVLAHHMRAYAVLVSRLCLPPHHTGIEKTLGSQQMHLKLSTQMRTIHFTESIYVLIKWRLLAESQIRICIELRINLQYIQWPIVCSIKWLVFC